MAGAAVAYFVGTAVADYAGAAIATYAATALAETAISGAVIVSASYAVGEVVGLYAMSEVAKSITGGQPQQQSPQARAQGILLNTTSNVDGIPVIYGTRRVGGTRVLCEVSGSSNEYLHLVIALGEGEINGVTNIYINDVLSTDARYSGLVTTEVYTGTDTQAASASLIAALVSKWTSAFQGKGVAYVYVRCKYSQSAFSGLPVITCDVQGRKVYDPRSGLTAFSNNPALCIRDYLTNARYGKGISTALIDDTAITAAANYCDALVAVPGGTQTRYTCDGVVDVNSTAYDNIKSLLTCCRGLLVYSGGVYKLLVDQAATAAFAFTEDNIVGSWSITQPGRRAKYNRVTGGFYNPAANWQPDYGISDSTAYRAQDNNLLLEAKLDLPFTADMYRAQQLAGLHLKQSRFGLNVRFTAMQAALRCEVGDVVSITHSTPGWTAKPFKVIQLTLRDDDEVDVVCAEYDASVYNLDTLTAITGAQTTNLPNPFTVGAPGTPSVAEALYQTTGSAGVKSKAVVSWAASADVFVQGYWLEYKLASDTAWSKLPRTFDTSFTISDLQPGIYQFQVRAENALGVLSAYSSTTTKELLGLTAAPADVSNFSVSKVGGVAVGAWDLTGDLDVRIGGRVVIRHSLQTTGATWQDGVVLDEFAGDSVSGLLPLITGTYMAKFKDSSNTYSANTASFLATEGLVTGFTVVATSTQAPTFAGAKTNTTISGTVLQLDSALQWDGFTDNMDTWYGVDSYGPLYSTGSYAFDTYLDLTSVATRRMEADLKVYSSDTGSFIDASTALIDDWSDMDGAVVNDCDATLYFATTDTDPAASPVWGAWTPFFVSDITCRAVKFKLDLVSGNPTHQIAVSTLTVQVKAPV